MRTTYKINTGVLALLVGIAISVAVMPLTPQPADAVELRDLGLEELGAVRGGVACCYKWFACTTGIKVGDKCKSCDYVWNRRLCCDLNEGSGCDYGGVSACSLSVTKIDLGAIVGSAGSCGTCTGDGPAEDDGNCDTHKDAEGVACSP
jgi:hypothetical protein